MARPSARYACGACGFTSPRWLGRCPDCGAWGSLVEEVTAPTVRRQSLAGLAATGAPPVRLGEIRPEAVQRLSTGSAEFDRVLGGGIVPGSLILVGGDPGVGKSTLLLQVAASLASRGLSVLYATGEESAAQVRLRAERLGTAAQAVWVQAESDLTRVEAAIADLRPHLVVVDSIQTACWPLLESSPGTVSQVRECAAQLLRIAKGQGVPIFAIGHVNKEGALAGPKLLEHVVDVVLHLEGDARQAYRVLRGEKNRFGATHEVGVFAIGAAGLTDVPNPSAALLAERPEGVSGSVVAAALEGTRTLLVEVQALVAPSALAVPRRTVTGLDGSRAALVLAVLERRLGLSLVRHDAYLKVVGGLHIEEPGLDLAVAVALTSSLRDVPARPGVVVAGEVGLGGEVRSVPRADARLREAARLGFSCCLLPASDASAVGSAAEAQALQVVGVRTVAEALAVVFGGGAVH
ncbi:MAG: DNA repair protein RadA [Clostridia bacterium]|nr:DNA repair protein RadA [Clostridia bacterium]